MQEPYIFNNSVVGMGISTKIVSDSKTFAKSVSDKRIKAAIVISNNSLDVLKIEQISNTHFACAQVRYGSLDFYIVSAYFQFSEPIAPYMTHLEKILSVLKGKRVLLCIDSNAKSVTWFSKKTDARGEALENLLAHFQIDITNRSSKYYTFDNARGKENIDLTGATKSFSRLVRKWKVHSAATTSDHNLVSFNIETSGNAVTKLKTDRFNIKKADWECYASVLVKCLCSCEVSSESGSASDSAADIESAILRAASTAIPKKSRFSKSAPWWNNNLTELRRTVRAARRRIGKTVCGKTRLEKRKEFCCLRNHYIRSIRKAKRDSWEKFATEAGNKDPWSLVYKIQVAKLKIESVIETIKCKRKQTDNLCDTMEELLQGMIPDDDMENESAWQLEVSKTVTKGCPQGSVLGPLMWNLILDEAIEEVVTSKSEIIAYADDIAVVVKGNSRKEMEIKARTVTNKLKAWCDNQKLVISAAKSHMILLKGYLDIKRPPTIPLGDRSLRMVAETKYLGVILGTRFNMTAHVNYISNKSKMVFSSLARVAKTNWGLGCKVMKTIYKGVFVPVITYAAAGWADKINVHHIRCLAQAQRFALIRTTKAYRTISSDALCVLADATPIELLLTEKRSLYFLRKNIAFTHFGVEFPEQEDIRMIITNARKRLVKAETTRKWQAEWNASNKGRITHEFCGSIEEKQTAKWMHLDHYMVQILSGHGNFKNKLKGLGLAETDTCECGEVDSVRHVIFDCVLIGEERRVIKEAANRQNLPWPCELKHLVGKNMFQPFAGFVLQALKQREKMAAGAYPGPASVV
ncbi:hypothetical protein M0802_015459 [Mischocyttarus mexicanus]|nr:hypothetical protein M0802_015459 [Mischocyttarus mexicanus]